jgi:hypothetical protein
MNKRRRAYKKYNWRLHSMHLIDEQLRTALNKSCGKYIDLAILYGMNRVEYREETVTLKAGLWKFDVEIIVPYLKETK